MSGLQINLLAMRYMVMLSVREQMEIRNEIALWYVNFLHWDRNLRLPRGEAAKSQLGGQNETVTFRVKPLQAVSRGSYRNTPGAASGYADMVGGSYRNTPVVLFFFSGYADTVGGSYRNTPGVRWQVQNRKRLR